MKFKDKPCKHCKTEFTPKAPNNLYCSSKCSKRGLIDNYYQNVYKSSINEVEMLLERQNYVCAICERPGFSMNEYVRSPLNLDHNHKTGVIRGLLCHNCNRGLGLFQDDPKQLRKAADYIEGATTISKESTYKCMEAHNTEK